MSIPGMAARGRRIAVIERKVYRAQSVPRVLGWVLALVFFLMGVLIAAGSPGDPAKGGPIGVVYGVAIGVCLVLLSLGLGTLLVTNGLTVTSDGLANRHTLRRRVIGWPEVESFTAGPGRGPYRFPTLIICLTDGSRVLTDVTSFTAKHPSQVARELTALQANTATSPPRPPIPPTLMLLLLSSRLGDDRQRQDRRAPKGFAGM
jgi:hypothetical protein